MTVSGVPEAAEVDRDLDLSPLFQPFACKSLQLANRIVMAPMTRAMSPGGVPGEDVAAYYRRRAENDVGLIVTEGTPVSELGAPGTRMPLFCGDALNGWQLSWSFAQGERVVQAWGAVATQSGTAVTVTNVSWNGALGQGGLHLAHDAADGGLGVLLLEREEVRLAALGVERLGAVGVGAVLGVVLQVVFQLRRLIPLFARVRLRRR